MTFGRAVDKLLTKKKSVIFIFVFLEDSLIKKLVSHFQQINSSNLKARQILYFKLLQEFTVQTRHSILELF